MENTPSEPALMAWYPTWTQIKVREQRHHVKTKTALHISQLRVLNQLILKTLLRIDSATWESIICDPGHWLDVVSCSNISAYEWHTKLKQMTLKQRQTDEKLHVIIHFLQRRLDILKTGRWFKGIKSRRRIHGSLWRKRRCRISSSLKRTKLLTRCQKCQERQRALARS